MALFLSTTAFAGCGWELGWDDYGGLTGETGETGDDYERTYFIAECTDYNECSNTPLNSGNICRIDAECASNACLCSRVDCSERRCR